MPHEDLVKDIHLVSRVWNIQTNIRIAFNRKGILFTMQAQAVALENTIDRSIGQWLKP